MNSRFIVSSMNATIEINVSGAIDPAVNGDYYTFHLAKEDGSDGDQIYFGEAPEGAGETFRFTRGQRYKFIAKGITGEPFKLFAYQYLASNGNLSTEPVSVLNNNSSDEGIKDNGESIEINLMWNYNTSLKVQLELRHMLFHLCCLQCT